MDDCFGYLIVIVLVVAAVIAFIVYVVIPCVMAIAALCLLIGVSIGLWQTSYNYIEAIHDAIVMNRGK